MAITPTTIIEYEHEHGARAAADLLILGGPDQFDGEYSTTLIYLEQIAMDEQDIEKKKCHLRDTDYPMWRCVYQYEIGKMMGRIAYCRQILKEFELGYQHRVKIGLHYA